MKRIFLLAALFLAVSTAVAQEQPVREYYVFETPALPATGPAFVSWFFMRNGEYWGNSEFVSLANTEWPTWDTNQIPVTLVPVAKQKTFILIYDAGHQLLKEVELKEPFAPEPFFQFATVKPAFYQVRTVVAQNHLELTSPYYPWYQKKRIATCEVDTSAPEFEVKKSRKLKLCMSTLGAYTDPEIKDERQYYIHIEWPSIKGRENIMAIKELERDLRVGARKRKMVFIVTKIKGSTMRAEIGLTLKENLPAIGFPAAQVTDTEKAESSPDTKTISRTLYEQELENGAKYKVLSYYSDAVAQRRLESPRVGKYQIDLQIVEGDTDPKTPVIITQSRTLEQRTGVLGFMRPVQILLFGGFNQLSSSRGEENSMFGLPGAEVRYNWRRIETQPYLSFEKDLLHLGSTLQVTEMKAGATRHMPWFEDVYYSLGYQEYSLSGKNQGSTRLGGISAFTVGASATQRFEAWQTREKFDVLFGNAQSFDFRFEMGRFLGSKVGSHYYFGPYVDFAEYRGYVVNKLKNRELFSENRLQVGVTFGWVGPESF